MYLNKLAGKITLRPVFPDLLLGIGLCLLMCSAFVLDTQKHRLIMYVTFIPALFFITRQHGWLRFIKEKNTLFISAVTFLLFACISLIWSQDIDFERIWQKLKVLPILTVFILGYAHYFKLHPKSWKYFIELFILAAAITAPLVLYAELPHYNNYTESYQLWRISGFGRAVNPNQAGLLYGTALLCLLFMNAKETLILKKQFIRILCAVSIFSIFILAVSRGAYLACLLTLCGILFLKIFQDYRNIKLLGLSTIVIALLGAVLIYLYPDIFVYVFERGSTGRLQIWQSAWEQYTNHALLGIGIGTKVYYNVHENIDITASHAHSLYVATLLHLGATGLFIFLFMCCCAVLKSMLIAVKELDYTPFILILFGLIFGLTDFGGYYISLSNEWIVFWIPLAYLISCGAPIFKSR